jgi:quinone-reactive Ni/Fe-hydrogenase small subunit
VLFGRVPQLDAFDRPVWAYGTRIHDKCERRGNFDAGEFVQSWADISSLKKGFCLYKVGCKGPFTYNNCGVVRYNQGTSWPIQAGHGCVGCSEPNFWDTMTPFHQPVAARVFSPPVLSDSTADRVGLWTMGAVAVGIAAHAVGTMVRSALEDRKASKTSPEPKE